MLSEKMQDALNQQLNAELYSGYMYLSMSSYFKSISLDGFAAWMHSQAQEELIHAMKFYDFIIQRGGRSLLAQVEHRLPTGNRPWPYSRPPWPTSRRSPG